MKRSDVLLVYETKIQRIWAEQDSEKYGMQTLDGRSLVVYFPVWWNRAGF